MGGTVRHCHADLSGRLIGAGETGGMNLPPTNATDIASLRDVPWLIVTDKLRSYGVAQRRLLPGVEQRQSRYLNNRAENSRRQHDDARTADATVQITRARSGTPLRPLVHPWPLPTAPTPTCSQCLSCDSARRFQNMTAGDLRPTHNVIGAALPPWVPRSRREVDVTMPSVSMRASQELSLVGHRDT
jgi:hypothetical protein